MLLPTSGVDFLVNMLSVLSDVKTHMPKAAFSALIELMLSCSF